MSFIGNNLKLILVVVFYPFCPLLLILLTVSRTKNDDWIYGNYKHFFIASSTSPPTTTYPVEDGKISFLFDYFNIVFDKMSSQTFSLVYTRCVFNLGNTFIWLLTETCSIERVPGEGRIFLRSEKEILLIFYCFYTCF